MKVFRKSFRRAASRATVPAQGAPQASPRDQAQGRRRRVRGTALLLGTLALASAAVFLGARAYLAGGLLTVSRLEVSGNRHWSAALLLEQAGLEIGQRFHEIPFRAARRNLLRLPGIESVTLRYVPGGRLRLEVREADIVAQRGTAAGWRGLTPGGEWMALSDRAPEDAPVLEGRGLSARAERRAAHYLASVRRRYPDVFAGFSQIALSRGGRDDAPEADVYWRDGRVKLRLDCGDASLRSLEYLGELLRREQASWPEGATVDLRVEGYAYVL
ncbi:MAG: hypothetical protein K0Q91_1091 [Fibrobacteria bacterium]|jgi:hypothetical protein|nr:hypothetical protein [Fibrobacteria bacterium]